MTIYLKDEATSKAVRKLAKLRGTTLTEAVRLAVQEALAKEDESNRRLHIRKAIQDAQERLASLPKVGKGQPADKTFYDELSGDI
jgi:antitoxin VapB